jgi:hypothetical protein
MEESPIGLDKWLMATWLIVSCKNGISSYEIHRALGVTQKTAWFLDHRIRLALHQGSFENLLSGECEADETLIGGEARNMHRGKRAQRITTQFHTYDEKLDKFEVLTENKFVITRPISNAPFLALGDVAASAESHRANSWSG